MEPNTEGRLFELLQKHEGFAFTITHLSNLLSVSRVSIRKHAKRLSKKDDPEAETENPVVRLKKGPGKFAGTGIVIWFGKGIPTSFYEEKRPDLE